MPRLKLTGSPAQALRGGPTWEPGEERDLSDADAAPYLKNRNWQVVQTATITVDVPTPPATPAPAAAPPEAVT